jgi:hypothetical protein
VSDSAVQREFWFYYNYTYNFGRPQINIGYDSLTTEQLTGRCINCEWTKPDGETAVSENYAAVSENHATGESRN